MPKQPETKLACGFYETPRGRGLVAASERQIERIFLPGSPDALVARLTCELGPAVPDPAHPVLAALMRQIEKYFAGARVVFDAPLNLDRLTPFQKKVVAAAREIPFGEVRTYGWLAARAGSPAAFRACGQVMAANCFPVVVPCHRVVAAGGGLGGFSGGIELKRWLLDLESGSV